jgi:hypothetical protein
MPPCEQAICIERHGECIPCRFAPIGGEINKHGSGEGTTDELDAIGAAGRAAILGPNADAVRPAVGGSEPAQG